MSDVLFPVGWLDGRPVPVEDIRAWVPSPGVQYGMGLFEGLKAYPRPGGVGVIALREHMERLYRAAEFSPFNFRPSVGLDLAMEAVRECLRLNGVREECYIRPCLYHEGTGHVALRKGTMSPTRFAVYVQRWTEPYLKPDGVRVTISPFIKPSHLHAGLKTSGNYVLLTEAKAEAMARGFDDCLLMDSRGLLAEAASENVIVQVCGTHYETFFVEPDWERGPILPGITARLLREIIAPAKDLRFIRRGVSKLDLARADGVLLCGTAAEVVHVREIDGVVYGAGVPSAEMRLLIEGYRDLVLGRAHQECVELITTPA